ncbi:MAG: hypothetical protein AAB638_01365, partial [Patescibacteria group bacterium]
LLRSGVRSPITCNGEYMEFIAPAPIGIPVALEILDAPFTRTCPVRIYVGQTEERLNQYVRRELQNYQGGLRGFLRCLESKFWKGRIVKLAIRKTRILLLGLEDKA